MGYTTRSNGSSTLAAWAVLAGLLFAWLSCRLGEFRDVVPRQGPKEAAPAGARLTPEELGYTDDVLDSDLLRPMPLFEQSAAAQGLRFQFMAWGFNHAGALAIDLHNANSEGTVVVDLPAGMVLAPAENRDLQNLVLREAVHVQLQPGETRRLEQWAFCGNQFHLPPLASEMKPTGWVMDAPPSQGGVWRATLPYETAVSAVEGHWMAAKLVAAVAA
ncbi:unnamed protein product [Prorocentrum cordatum]|uniref:Uncharacterized protein n=1 Tax=Prorocentrum cordatum TaxID=2364126 RepID=A0ABN9PI06_9DINO|nr:unnamed protein product [Polarella glacialis]